MVDDGQSIPPDEPKYVWNTNFHKGISYFYILLFIGMMILFGIVITLDYFGMI